ncbi:MAG: hypothetical protein NTV46_10835 [Verrucomicrobia bacterium]|nr:hypothetical protein [Verrucomicrobiota bacterium]
MSRPPITGEDFPCVTVSNRYLAAHADVHISNIQDSRKVMNFVEKCPSGFWLLVATEGVMTAGYAISFPFLAIYLSTHRGLPMVWVGMFLAVSLLVASAAQFIGGEVSDVIGRRKVMVFSLALR